MAIVQDDRISGRCCGWLERGHDSEPPSGLITILPLSCVGDHKTSTNCNEVAMPDWQEGRTREDDWRAVV
jgi:hypothetical protein